MSHERLQSGVVYNLYFPTDPELESSSTSSATTTKTHEDSDSDEAPTKRQRKGPTSWFSSYQQSYEPRMDSLIQLLREKITFLIAI